MDQLQLQLRVCNRCGPFFSHTSHTHAPHAHQPPATPSPSRATALETARFAAWVDDLSATGTTNLNDALTKAFSLLEASSDMSSGCTKAILVNGACSRVAAVEFVKSKKKTADMLKQKYDKTPDRDRDRKGGLRLKMVEQQSAYAAAVSCVKDVMGFNPADVGL